MNRWLAALAVFGLAMTASVTLACDTCGCSPCQTTGGTTAYRVVTRTRVLYRNHVTCTPVVRMSRVTYIDACGCLRTKCVRRVSWVQTCRRVRVSPSQPVGNAVAPVYGTGSHYGTAAYGTHFHGVPAYGVQGCGAPAYGVHGCGAPVYRAPVYRAPGCFTPRYAAPTCRTPWRPAFSPVRRPGCFSRLRSGLFGGFGFANCFCR